jgi:hypothetical protein
MYNGCSFGDHDLIFVKQLTELPVFINPIIQRNHCRILVTDSIGEVYIFSVNLFLCYHHYFLPFELF